MIIEKSIVQGSPEWNSARCGIPTASGFDKIVTTKGALSKSSEKYMYQLAAERITKRQEESYKNGIMDRGLEMEDQARAMYEILTGNDVETVGICYYDDRKTIACSPDGLVGKDGLLEIKCPSSAVHVSYLLEGVLPTEYFQQVQGQLFVTGRKWCDFFSFYPNLPPFLLRVESDKEFIKKLQVELEVFVKQLSEVIEKIRSK
jgi:putative phage-type endonuclease